MTAPGPTNSLTDVAGLRVGHCTRAEPGWLTGTTVVVAPEGGVVAGVDVRGAAPGTRETDLLDPRNLVDRVNAVVLGGGSAPGLAAATGIVEGLFADGLGWPMGDPGRVVPIVPGAVLFDLGRGGTWEAYPVAKDGRAAYDAASSGPVETGCVGAGTGAKAGGLKGGIGSAVDARTGELYAVRWGLGDEFAHVGRPSADEVAEARARAESLPDDLRGPAMATTIGVVATDATLTKAQCQKLAGIGHDGFARALKPVHTLFDGDTLFALATGSRPAPDVGELVDLMEAGADCVARAIGHAMLAARSVDRTADGGLALRSWADAFPSALRNAADPTDPTLP